MMAAGILGHPALGLGSLLMEEFGVRTNKRYQRANWGERPLPAYLKKYAQQDTHYLIPLRDRLQESLRKRNLWRLAREDFDRLCKVKTPKNCGLAQGDVERGFWRIHGAYDLNPQNAAVLFELCKYRDKVARSQNRPLFKVLSDQALLAIAQQSPLDLAGFNEIPRMSERQIRRHGRNLVQAVRKGLNRGPLYPPKRKKPNGRYLNRIDILKRWRKAFAGKMGVNPDVVLPRDLLNSVAKKNPSCREELAEVFEAVPWRMEHFGDQIIAVLKD
jgi:ribonuclease D